MDNINVDDAILSNMGNGLQSLIQNTAPQAASSNDVIPGTNLAFAQEQVPAGVGQAGNVGPAANGGLVTPQTQGQVMSPAEVARLRDIAFQATQGKIEAEEQLFEAQLQASDLTEVEKELIRTQRELQQTQQVNGWLNNQQMTVQQAAEMNAKNQFGFLIAHQTGLPYENPAVKQALMTAQNSDEMRQIAVNLAQAINANQRQQVAGQVQSGIFQAGGNNGGIPAASQPKQFSGDLAGLIGSRQPVHVNWS